MRLLRPLTLEDASRSAFAAVRTDLKSPRWLRDPLVYQSPGRFLLHSNHKSPPFARGPVAGISSLRQPDLRRPRVPISAAHRHVRLSVMGYELGKERVSVFLGLHGGPRAMVSPPFLRLQVR